MTRPVVTGDPVCEMGARSDPGCEIVEIPGMYVPEFPYCELCCDRFTDVILTFAGSVIDPPEVGRFPVPHETFDPKDATPRGAAINLPGCDASGVEVRLEAFPVIKPPYDTVAVALRGVPASDDCFSGFTSRRAGPAVTMLEMPELTDISLSFPTTTFS